MWKLALLTVLVTLIYIPVAVNAYGVDPLEIDPLGTNKTPEGKTFICNTIKKIFSRQSLQQLHREYDFLVALRRSFQPENGDPPVAVVRALATGPRCTHTLEQVAARSLEYDRDFVDFMNAMTLLSDSRHYCQARKWTKRDHAKDIEEGLVLSQLLHKGALAAVKQISSRANVEESIEEWKSICRQEEIHPLRYDIQPREAVEQDIDATEQEIEATGQETRAVQQPQTQTTKPEPAPSNTTALPWFSRLWNDHDTWVGYIKQALRLGRAFRGRVEPGTPSGSNWSGNFSIWIGCLAWCQQDFLMDGMLSSAGGGNVTDSL